MRSACTTDWLSESPCLSQMPDLESSMRLDLPRKWVASICSKRAVVAEASGLTTVMKRPPSSAAMTSAGSRNCQTETPAARATTSSRLRVIFAKVTMPPTSTMKGSAFCAMKGMCRDAI